MASFGGIESMALLDGFLTYAPALSAIAAALAFIKGVIEYRKQNSLKRFEEFMEMRAIFRSPEIYNISLLIEKDDTELKKLPLKDRYAYLGFYEQVAIMLNSGILRRDIAHYMFGYFAVRCLESKNFWSGINRSSGYWSLFVWFASEMKKIEEKFPKNLKVERLKI